MAHQRFPARMAFLLNNPVRRYIDPPNRLISELGIDSSMVVVDFGCGPGYYTVPISKIAGRTIGVDASSEMLKKAAIHAKNEGAQIEFLESDGTKINFENSSVDLVFLFHVFHEVENGENVLREFKRILKPQGRLAILEKTQNSLLGGLVGPPTVSLTDLIERLTALGFRHISTVPRGKNSLLIVQND